MNAHTLGADNIDIKPFRTGIVLISDINVSCPHPSSSDVAAVIGLHNTVHLHHFFATSDPVVPRRSRGVALLHFLARGGRQEEPSSTALSSNIFKNKPCKIPCYMIYVYSRYVYMSLLDELQRSNASSLQRG